MSSASFLPSFLPSIQTHSANFLNSPKQLQLDHRLSRHRHHRLRVLPQPEERRDDDPPQHGYEWALGKAYGQDAHA
ncbi:hypothetical protein CPC08DRAFT_431268 [Agrocybe pediades]|nr:hypothetical protein CPC08DRAFT_431268 [Agrocybe pediades]